MKSVSGTLKLDLAQFRELEAFATFGSELDAVSKAQLERGDAPGGAAEAALHAPMPVEEQVVSIFAGTTGYLDDIPVDRRQRFETELLDYMRTRKADLMATIRDTGALPDGVASRRSTSSPRASSPPRRAAARPTSPRPTRRRSVRRHRPRRSRRSSSQHGRWSGAHPPAPHPIGAVDEEDHARDGADRGQSHRQGAGARARPRCRTPTASPRSCATCRRAAAATIRCSCRAPRSARSRYVVIAADRGLCGGYNSSVIRAAEARDPRARARSAATTRSSPSGRKAEGYFRFRELPHRRRARGLQRQPHLRGRARSPRSRSRRARSRRARPRPDSCTRGSSRRAAKKSIVRPLLPLDSEDFEGGRTRGDAGGHERPGRRGEGGVRVRAEPRRDPRRAAAALRGSARLRRAARTRPRRSTRPASAR